MLFRCSFKSVLTKTEVSCEIHEPHQPVKSVILPYQLENSFFFPPKPKLVILKNSGMPEGFEFHGWITIPNNSQSAEQLLRLRNTEESHGKGL